MDLVGQTDLSTLVASLSSDDMVLASDTGALHLAVAQGTPAIGLDVHSNPHRPVPFKGAHVMTAILVEQEMEKISRAENKMLYASVAIEDVVPCF